jgi:hypothetical protein
MKIFKPKNLNLKEFVDSNPPDFEFNYDVAYYIIWLINKVPYTNRDKYSRYVSLCAITLREQVGRASKPHIDYLLKCEILKRGYVDFNANQVSCTPYKIEQRFALEELEVYEIKDRGLIKRINRGFEIPNSIFIDYSHLTKIFVSLKFTIDLEKAIKFNNEQYHQMAINGKTLEGYRKYTFNCISLLYLSQNQKWIVKNPESDNRLHTNITNMSKELRKFLFYDEEPLVNVDLKNSQPFFLLILINYLKNCTSLHKNSEWIIKIVNSKNSKSKQSTIKMAEMAESIDITEFCAYKDSVESGRIYELLGDAFLKEYPNEVFKTYKYIENIGGKPYTITTIHDNVRDFVKVSLFEIYFGQNKKSSKFKKVFKLQFPTIFKLLETIKEDDHKKLSKFMQQIESFVILDYVTKKIYQEHKIPMFTIHDSIATTSKNVDTLYCDFSKHIVELTGFTPTLSVECWSDSKIKNLPICRTCKGVAA